MFSTKLSTMNNTQVIRLKTIVVTMLLALILNANGDAAELPGAGPLADLIMMRFDTNGDSKIDTGEWQMGTAASFEEIDADRDGKISAAEIDGLGEAIAKEVGAAAGALVPKLIKPILLAMDADGDGAVSREEFAKKVGAVFATLDANMDAVLTRTELLALPLKMLVPANK
jgi:hypothetical protein